VNPAAIYTSKTKSDCAVGTCALDMERGIIDQISPVPWQTDTCIGGWHYKKDIKYKTPKTVIDMFADIVSRNGNLLLNFPLPGSGELDPEELRILAAITDWMAVNSEAIYSSRPWKIYGIGPSTVPVPVQPNRPRFNENGRKALTAEDVRFTTKGHYLYALVMGWPEKEAVIKADTGKVHNVELLGHKGKLKWTQDAASITIQLPETKPCDHAVTFKLALT
jgi:alpha-L-fucosidase